MLTRTRSFPLNFPPDLPPNFQPPPLLLARSALSNLRTIGLSRLGRRELTGASHARQIEFSRLNLQYCVVSKRKLIQLVDEGHVNGWDDPRMPTICGCRRGVLPEALRLFVERTGVSKADNNIDYSVLEDCVRETLEPRRAPSRCSIRSR